MTRTMTGCGAGIAAILTGMLASGPAMSGEQYFSKHGFGKELRFSLADEPDGANVNTDAGEGCPIETPDGLSLMFASNRDGTLGAMDIWAADRSSLDSPWQEPRNLGEPVNSGQADFCPTPVRGRALLFVSEREVETACGGGDMYYSRQSPAGEWSDPVNLGCAPEGPNFGGLERSPSLISTHHGTFLFYSSTGDSPGGGHDIYVSKMRSNGTFGPGRIVDALSTEDDDIMPNVRKRKHGGLEIFYSSNRTMWGRKSAQPAFGGHDVYAAFSLFHPYHWTLPQNLGPNVNTAADEQRSTISADGERLYFGRSGDIWVSRRER